MERWKNRVAIVTGAGSGIGLAIARALVENGLKVVACDMNIQNIDTLVLEFEGKILAKQCNVTKDDEVVSVIKWTRENLGGADVLVNSAGVWYQVSLTEISTEQMSKMLNTNVLGLSLFTREFIKDMKERGINDGHIFHISSSTAHKLPDEIGKALYAASKHAVLVLTEGLRRELKALGTKIKISSISPGTVKTGLKTASGISQEDSDKYYSNHPCLEPSDVASALLYSLSTPPHVQVHDIILYPIGD